MYGKLFASMYDGTLGASGQWQALVTFQQMIILADEHGVVDMTPEALSRRTTIPLEIIQAGVVALEAADPGSRSSDEDGRRITRISDSRDWGWQITNHGKYRAIRTADERRDYFREQKRKQRGKEPEDSQQCPPVSTAVHTMSSKSTNSSKQKQKHITPSVDQTAVLEHYVRTHPRRRTGDKDAAAVAKALAMGYSPGDLCDAIDGNAHDPWHAQKHKHELEYVLRNTGLIDGFREKAAARQRLVSQPLVESGWMSPDLDRATRPDEH